MSDWTDFLQGVAILLLAFACISNSLWIRQVNRYFRDQEKQRQRNRRIIAGHSLTQHRTLYRRSAELWTRFQLGYLDTVRDMRRAQAQKEARHG